MLIFFTLYFDEKRLSSSASSASSSAMIIYEDHTLTRFSGRAEEKHVIKIKLSAIHSPHHPAT